MKIYTRKGDDGKTGLIGGDRVSKHHIRVESYGTVDELNSHLGLLRSQISDQPTLAALAQIQDRLFTLGSSLASAPGNRMVLPELYDSDIAFLESEIDRMTSKLPELKNFVLPGATQPGAQAHVARCVCRRAERMVAFLADNETLEPLILIYLNRLSDYLFTTARFLDHELGGTEIAWSPRSK
ncbi:MAG: cob(I)yrinic acid a,c-diamide adenosyltransferase [Bacteroidetes bacterium]|nr:cob(I)yrinic acid a,c-diamide adenosyltransferase [Bacteroidota bacterium]